MDEVARDVEWRWREVAGRDLSIATFLTAVVGEGGDTEGTWRVDVEVLGGGGENSHPYI